MLRAAVILVAALIAAAGIVLLSHGVHAAGWEALGVGLIVLLGTLFERWRYTRESREGAWQSTGERFLDPTSGAPVEVLYDPSTGERRYVTQSGESVDPPGRAGASRHM